MNNPTATPFIQNSNIGNYILDQSSDKIMILDHNYKVKYFNPAAKAFSILFEVKKLDLEVLMLPDTEKYFWKKLYDRVLIGESLDFKKSYVIEEEKLTDLISLYPIKKDNDIIGIGFQAKTLTDKYSPKKILSSEKLFKSLFDTSPFGITIRNFETEELITFNDQICSMFDCSREEFRNYTRKDFVHSEDTETITNNTAKLRNQEIKNFKLIKQYKKKDGSIFFGIATRSAFEVDGITYQIGILENIDQQKKIEKKLIDSEASIKAIFNSTTDKIFAINKDYKLIHANKAALKNILHFIPKEDALKQQSEDIDLRRLEYFTAHFVRAFAGEQYSFETDFYYIGDQVHADLISIAPLKNIKGEIIGASVYGKEITTIKNYQKALAKTTSKLKEAEKIAGLGSWELDVATSMLTWSESVFDIYKLPYKKQPFHLKQFYRLVHPEDVQPMKDAINKTITQGVPYELESRRIKINGESIFALGKWVPHFEDGKVTKVFGTIQNITKEKRIKKALQESEAKMRAIFNSTDDKIYAIDREYRLIDFNNSAAKRLPPLFEKEELVIGDVMLAQKESLRNLWIAHYDEVLSGKKLILEKKYKEDGIDKTDIVTLSPIRNKNGETIGVALYGREITDLQEAKREVKKTQIQLNDAQNVGKIGNWKYDSLTKKITWSESILKMFKYDQDETNLSIQDCINLVHPEDLSRMMEAVYNSIKKGVPYDQELRMFTKNRKNIYTRGKGIPTMDKDNQLIKFEGTIQDITNLKNFEENIQSSNQRYRELFETVLDGIVVTDQNGIMVEANPAAEKLLGYPKEELSQMFIKDIVHPEDQEKSKHFLKQLQDQGYYIDYRGRIIHSDGTIRYIQVNSNAIYKNGKMVGSRDIVRDISQLHEAEQKRKRLNEELANVNKELKDFAHIVSHDLKAPLRAIKAISTWLSEDYGDKLDKEGQEQLSLLGNRVHRMHQFIEGIFEYTKMGRVKETKELVELMQVINNTTLMLNLNENTEISILKKLPEIYCEKIKIEQVFQNLISNAIKYNDKKICKIEIDYKDLGTHYLFCIKDNGKGIEEKNFKKIFQIFQTLQPKDDFESTGIGLSIVKKIVQFHGGEIWVKSELGKSTTFKFTLKK